MTSRPASSSRHTYPRTSTSLMSRFRPRRESLDSTPSRTSEPHCQRHLRLGVRPHATPGGTNPGTSPSHHPVNNPPANERKWTPCRAPRPRLSTPATQRFTKRPNTAAVRAAPSSAEWPRGSSPASGTASECSSTSTRSTLSFAATAVDCPIAPVLGRRQFGARHAAGETKRHPPSRDSFEQRTKSWALIASLCLECIQIGDTLQV